MMLKKKIVLALILIFSTFLSACEKEESKPSSTTTTTASNTNTQIQQTWLMFYSKNYYLGYIDIYVNNVYRGTVTNWYSYQPACGSSGCVTVQIFGPFTWYAVRRSDGYVYSSNIMTYPGCNSFFFY